jgi:hypothetical protein
VQFTGSEGLTGVVVEVGHEALVGVRRLPWQRFVVGRGDVRDDLAGSPQVVEACLGPDQRCREVIDLLLQVLGVRGGGVLLCLEPSQEFGGVHAASSRSRQAVAGVVSRRVMFAVAAQ